MTGVDVGHVPLLPPLEDEEEVELPEEELLDDEVDPLELLVLDVEDPLLEEEDVEDFPELPLEDEVPTGSPLMPPPSSSSTTMI